MNVDNLDPAPSDKLPERPKRPRRLDGGTMLVMIHGIIAAIAAAYVETDSEVITTLAAVAALLFAAWFTCRK